MMVSVEKAGSNFHVLKHHVVAIDVVPVLCEGHSMALLTGPGSTTFELDRDSGIFVTVERREPISPT